MSWHAVGGTQLYRIETTGSVLCLVPLTISIRHPYADACRVPRKVSSSGRYRSRNTAVEALMRYNCTTRAKAASICTEKRCIQYDSERYTYKSSTCIVRHGAHGCCTSATRAYITGNELNISLKIPTRATYQQRECTTCMCIVFSMSAHSCCTVFE